MSGLRILVCVTALGSGLVGGVFFAFSGFVMPALRRLPAGRGVATMQAINVAAVTAPLMTALFGTAAATVAVVVVGLVDRTAGSPASVLLVVAGVCYLMGVVGVTTGANVPLNDRLAAAGSTFTDEDWAGWVKAWSGFNLVRTISSLAAAALYSAALLHLQVDDRHPPSRSARTKGATPRRGSEPDC